MERRQINITLSDIDFGNRNRQEYGDLEKLAEEIKEVGLIHPVTVIDKTAVGQGVLSDIETSNAPYLLVAGGRRTKAHLEFKISDSIPAYVYPRTLNTYELRKIELMENISRKDLTWVEESMMTGEVHELEQKIKGKSFTSNPQGHSLQDTAEMLGKSKSSVKNEVDLAQALKHLPELAEIKNKTEAIKIMRQLKKTSDASKRAKQVEAKLQTEGVGALQEELINSFVVGDFFTHAEKLPDKTFDLIEIDPPYGIDLGNIKKDSKHTTLHYNEVDAKEYEAFMLRTFLYAKKLLKSDGWLVCWYAISPWHDTVLKALMKAGFKTNGLPALWIKNGGQTNRPMHYFGSCYEPFFYARIGESARLNTPGAANYLIHSKVPSEQKFHPTQRPISLMEDVITRFIDGGKILVPFAGSGVTLRAASNLKLKAIGYDLAQDAKNHHTGIVGEWDGKSRFEI